MQSDEPVGYDSEAAVPRPGASRLEVWSESVIVDDTGCAISTYQVNVPGPGSGTPVEGWPLYLPVLVKVCEQQHLIDRCKTLRLSRPPEFRGAGGTLMGDPEEARVSREWAAEDDPAEMARARLQVEEENRAGQLVGASDTRRVTKTRHTQRHFADYGDNAWLWCSSIIPADDNEWERLRADLPASHDHYWAFHSPRMFARALGAMFVDQVGPRCSEAKLTRGDAGGATRHSSQFVFHGPVVYADDPYSHVVEAATPVERLVLPLFVKRPVYKHQREYRFVVWDDSKPEETVLTLDASPALMATTLDRQSGPVPSTGVAPAPRTPPPPPTPLPWDPADTPDPAPSMGRVFPLPMYDDPHVNHHVRTIDADDAPDDLGEKTAVYAAVETLRRIVGNADNEPEAAAAAWHADPYIRRLCAEFQDPIDCIRLTPDNFIVIEVGFPEDSDAYGKIAVGPRGTVRHKIRRGRENTDSTSRSSGIFGWPRLDSFEKVLSTYDLPRRSPSLE